MNISENNLNKLLENNMKSNDTKNKEKIDKYKKEISYFV